MVIWLFLFGGKGVFMESRYNFFIAVTVAVLMLSLASVPVTYAKRFVVDTTVDDVDANPGDGISHAWYTCQAGPVALPGWGWIYEPGPAQICVVPHTEAGAINIGDCSGLISGPEVISCAGIAGADGDDPCQVCGVQPTTWGHIKAMFR